MLNKIITILVGVVLTLFQLAFMSVSDISWLNLNLVLVSIVTVGLIVGGKTAFINAVVLSLIYDSMAARTPGTYFILYLIVSLIIKIISKHLFSLNVWIVAMFSFIATLFTELFIYWIFFAFNKMAYTTLVLTEIIFPQCLANFVMSILLYWVYNRILKFKND